MSKLSLSVAPKANGGTSSALSLDGIAMQIHNAWAETKTHQVAAWDGYFTTGRLLMEARSRFPDNIGYGKWFTAQGFQFKGEWGRRLMIVASREPEVRELFASALANAAPGVDSVLAELTGTHIANNSGEMEWYTPAEYIAAAREVMGGIDLDPCSTEIANEVVGAMEFYTAAQDGLQYAWKGKVWMNPPYHKELIYPFLEKLCEEVAEGNVTEAICLTNNSTETVAFQRMAEIAGAMCFPKGRITYWYPDRTSKTGLQGQAFIYFGDNVERFREVFLRFGFTVAL